MSGFEGGGRECKNTPFSGADLDIVLSYRKLLVNLLVRSRPAVTVVAAAAAEIAEEKMPTPMETWQMLFLSRLDPYITQTVSRLIGTRNYNGMPQGYLYVFRDDRDPPNVYKIGSTTRTVQRRIKEWRKQLDEPDGRRSVHLLFSQAMPAVRLAEQIVHTLFFCEWLPRRIDVRTGRRLMEYFRVNDIAALRLLLQGTAIYLQQRARTIA